MPATPGVGSGWSIAGGPGRGERAMMMRMVLVVAALAAGVTAVVAQQDAAKERDALMKANGRHYYRDWNRMVRGQDPYDQAKVDAGLAQFAEGATKITTLVPENSKPAANTDEQYIASLKIWENKPDFDAKAAALAKVVADHRGKITDVETLKAGRTAIGQACDSCHELYMVKTR
jgi:cytochrome c556